MDIKISNASLVLLNLTLQFIAIEQLAQIIRKIYDGLNDGGACILTEKIILQNKNSDRLFQQMHENFKLANKYSQLEISQKRKALENVLVRESLEVHTQRLTQSGFTNVNTWFQCMNFVSILAIK